ncbi:MAG: putative bifunctional diguanylate cyclase/phosphodiesterase, partial [Nocardioidaceae bacterium]
MDDQHAHHDCDRCERLERRYQREHRARLESESIAEKFSREALHDPLTGLGNRTMFLGQLDTALERAHRTRTYLGLLFLDLDDFKLVNDTLGHAAGDQLLAAIGHRIAGCVRAGDVAARLGGDEFVVLVENVLDAGALEEVAERIRAKLLEPCRLGGQEWRTRVSIGIRLADGTDDVAAVLRDADAAMYAAKDAGKGRLRHHVPGSRAELVERVDLQHAVRQAVEDRDITVWYQPIVDLVSGDVVGAEALARWEHRQRGMVPPDQFIAVAEQLDLLGDLGEQLMTRACEQTAAWAPRPEWVTHFNVNPRELEDPDLPDRTATTLRRHGLAGEQLCLEITESSLISDDRVVRRNLKALRDQGLGLAIDDFGVAYSSFSHLKRLPVGVLKIDRSFVAGVGADPKDDAIVSAVVAMAGALGLTTVAEGVETLA